MYCDGETEAVLGRLLGDVVPRDDVLIATKAVAATGRARRPRRLARPPALARWTPRCAGSASTTSTCGSCTPGTTATPLEETLAALDTAVASGRARYVGVSQLLRLADRPGRDLAARLARAGRRSVSTQVEYSLLQRGVEREVVPGRRGARAGLLPWSPLGRGVLTGKYRHGTPADSRGASPHFGGFVDALPRRHGRRIVEAVTTAADGLGVSPLGGRAGLGARPARAWSRPIVGARTAAQLQASLDADGGRLPAEIRTRSTTSPRRRSATRAAERR